ncbi:MAG: D-2-hydroxyacid dehydrogenase [Candidatus Poribacteria bacterium]|nr:D-2-hydroxyacid dehydrogenase [Candidatus Poribacteria bacterium]
MKIVMASQLSDSFLNELRTAFPAVTFQPAATQQEQIEQIQDADVYYGEPSREVFLAAQKLHWIQCPGTGIDRIVSIAELRDSDVILTNARGPHANPMADHAFSMILTFAHCTREQWEDQKAHRWDTPKYDERVMELNGRMMGILALGGIGQAVARRAHGFGMEVYAVDIQPMPAPPEVTEVWGIERLDDLLPISDWFVITAPLTPQTRGLIDRRRIERLKPGGYIIAISRGGILDESALIDGLRSGRIAGAGLDVMAQEPLPADSPLWGMDNVILSPHASALTPEMWEARRQIFKENFRRFLADEPFLYVCDKQAGF